MDLRPDGVIFYASRQHYARHLQPVADVFGLPVLRRIPKGPPPSHVVIAGASDLDKLRRTSKVALVEHGAGQTYLGLDHRSWAGGGHRDKVSLFLCPRQEICDLNLARYPDAQAVAVGCPALDRHVDRAAPTSPLVVFTFHAEYAVAQQIPELRSAFEHYRSAIPETVEALRAEGVEVVGHWHPRSPGTRNFWRSIGVDQCEDWDPLLGRLTVLVADNTSAGWEANAVGAPAVWLNIPDYRREVDHGLRFWSKMVGIQVDRPEELSHVVRDTVRSSGSLRQGALLNGAAVYRPLGGASERAAAAIRLWVGQGKSDGSSAGVGS